MTATVRSSAWPAGSALGAWAVSARLRFAGMVIAERAGQAGRLFDVDTATDRLFDVSEFDCEPGTPPGELAAELERAPAIAALSSSSPALEAGDLVLVVTKNARPASAPIAVDVDELARMVVDGEVRPAALDRSAVVLLAGRVRALKAGAAR